MTSRILVAGGLNVDTLARVAGDHRPGTSNPGVVGRTPGGVARNVAANLVLLGEDVTLAGAVGDDDEAGFLLDGLAGVDLARVRRRGRTGSYVAILDGEGELVSGVADMAATEALTAEDIGPIDSFDWLVLDGNLMPTTVATVLARAAECDLPVLLDPVGVAKAARLASVRELRVHTLTPTRDELRALTGRTGVEDAVQELYARGAARVWLREGAEGSRLFAFDAPTLRIVAPRVPVVDVTGAGDAMLAGYLHALAAGDRPESAARVGAAAAALTIACAHSVRPDLSAALLRRSL